MKDNSRKRFLEEAAEAIAKAKKLSRGAPAVQEEAKKRLAKWDEAQG